MDKMEQATKDTETTILTKKVIDVVTGLKGIATEHTIVLGGANKVKIEYLYHGEIKHDWILESRLQVIKEDK